ncbi:MAG: undecaprenyl-diphosphate phosphatase [Actinobacteria bacterium]|nr:undecaprenyl-diphosphate phosphatase [Actinomycetota bacterium]
MNWLQAVVLGAVQGLTEFLPISSTGHLRIVPALAHWEDPGAAVSAVIQLGTMAAVVLFFRADLARIAAAWLRSVMRRGSRVSAGGGDSANVEERHRHDARIGWFIIAGTTPIGIAGLVFKHSIETSARDLRLIASTLIVLGIVMWLADRFGAQRKTVEDLRTTHAMYYGVAQALALIPGVSRSGATITAGRLMGFSREAAARYSFLLSVPAVVLSGLLEAVTNSHAGPIPWPQTIVATAVAFLVGYASIAWLLKWLSTHSTAMFAAYRVVLGSFIWLLLARGTLSPF